MTMQSLREMLEAAARYSAEQAAENRAIEQEKAKNRKTCSTAAESRARRARNAPLDPALCSTCQKEPKYKTKAGVSYGTQCYTCITKQRLEREAKNKKPGSKEKPAGTKNNKHFESATC
jgi:hypothetical protein